LPSPSSLWGRSLRFGPALASSSETHSSSCGPAGMALRPCCTDSSHGVHRFPSASHCPCVHSRSDFVPCGTSPVLRTEPCRARSRSVLAVPPGSNGFLRRSSPRERGELWQLAGLLRPAAGLGVRHVSSASEPRGSVDLAVVHGPKIAPRHPRWRRPFEAFPSPVACPSSPPSFRRRTAFTERSCPLVVGLGASSEPLAVVCTTMRARKPFPRHRPQGFAPPESPLRRRDVAVP